MQYVNLRGKVQLLCDEIPAVMSLVCDDYSLTVAPPPPPCFLYVLQIQGLRRFAAYVLQIKDLSRLPTNIHILVKLKGLSRINALNEQIKTEMH